jgi:hypothetical protein
MAQAIQRRWADNFEAQVWVALAYELDDPELALAMVRQVCARKPRHPRAATLLVAFLYRTGWVNSRDPGARTPAQTRGLQEVVDLAQKAVASGRSNPHITALHCLARRHLGAAEAMPLPDEPVDAAWSWRLSTAANPAALHQRAEQLFARPWPRATALEAIYTEGERLGDETLLDRIWSMWSRTFPDRHSLDYKRMKTLYRRVRGTRKPQETWQTIGKLAPNVGCDLKTDPAAGTILAMGLVSVRDWRSLLNHAEQWRLHGDPDSAPQADCYLGLAASRLGDLERAGRHLALATDKPPPEVTGWYRYALVEKAWQLVASGNEAPSAGKRAAECLERYDALPKKAATAKDGRWIQFVRASVVAAMGDRQQALALAQQARTLVADPQAPADLDEMMAAAIERWSK